MSKLLPYRSYNEHDVVNGLFSADSNSMEAGTFVSVSVGNGASDPFEYVDYSYLGKTDFPNVGANQYPVVSNKVTVAPSGALAKEVLGVTLYDVREYDENGEKLLYKPTKKEELQAVLSGEALPIARKGIFTLTTGAYVGAPDPVTAKFGVIEQAGRVTAMSYHTLTGLGYTMDNVVGTFLSTPKNGTYQGSQSGVLFMIG